MHEFRLAEAHVQMIMALLMGQHAVVMAFDARQEKDIGVLQEPACRRTKAKAHSHFPASMLLPAA
ncbi:MAG: hypothetical protein KKC01_04505 [Gammaproteobacteria bacterium]|nr:hypothetical protein [Gammaproteobacteria bacterium]